MAIEARRQCGYRKIGGTYLVADGAGAACGRFPIRIAECPLCGHRPAFTRGIQRITPGVLLHAADVCALNEPARCAVCPLGKIMEAETAGLVWVGRQYYSPASFAAEAAELGVSKRLPRNVPAWLREGLGALWVFFAHEDALSKPCATCESKPPEERLLCLVCEGRGRFTFPAVFFACRPTRLEHVIPDDMPAAARAKLTARGLTLVEVPADDPDHAPRKKARRR